MSARVGVVGAGAISGIYLENSKRFAEYDVVAVADLDHARADAAVEKYGVGRAVSVDELLASDDVDVVLNLTVPKAHFSIAEAALKAGKHSFAEKPLAVRRDEGKTLVDLAAASGLRLGVAPDTFLGAGLQTCRALVDDGAIGQPVAGTAFMTSHGHESWHPAPQFFYQAGGGPLFDMGPYYVTALISLLGPIKRVTARARATFPEREITSQPFAGEKVPVEVDTHIAGVLEFASGAIVTLIMTFDVWAAQLPRIELYGVDGSMSVPDPNGFGGPISVWHRDQREWTEVPVTAPFAANSRGVGLADMCGAVGTDRPHRASGDLGYHALDAMWALIESSQRQTQIELTSTCERPAPLGDDVGPI